MIERTLTLTQASRDFSDLVNRVYYKSESALLMKNGVPVARIIPARPAASPAKALSKKWKTYPRLGKSASASFAADVKSLRTNAVLPRDPWA